MEDLIATLKENVECILQNYIGEKKTVIIGVSGGSDSVALLDLIQEPAQKLQIKIIIAHLNHGLRGHESDEDELFVKTLAQKYNCECFTEKANVLELQKTQKLSLEDAGRQARYTFFYRLKEEHAADFILLAHHRDDSVETILLNLIRGCGIRGLTGMAMSEKDIIRPLLDFSKKELEQYCTEKKLTFREDKTNTDTKFRRNYVRHKLLPVIEKMNPNFREMLHMKSFYFEEIENLLTVLSLDFIKKFCRAGDRKIIMSLASFKKLMPAVQRSVIQMIYELFHGSTKGLTYEQMEEILNVMYRERTGTEKLLGKRLSLIVAYGKAIFQREREEKNDTLPQQNLQIPIPGILRYPGGKITTRFKKMMPKNRAENKIYIVAKDKSEPFFMRRFQPGDRFRPFGMAGTKKIQDFFTDEKIPRSLRRNIPIITDQKGEIVAVGNLRVDRKFHPRIIPGVIVEIEFGN